MDSDSLKELTETFERMHNPNFCFCGMPHISKIETRRIKADGCVENIERIYACSGGHKETVGIEFRRICAGTMASYEICPPCGLCHEED